MMEVLIVEEEACESHQAYDENGMHPYLPAFIWKFEIDEAERYGADRDAAYEGTCVMIGREVGPVHQHYGGRGYQTYHYRPQSGEYGLDHSAFIVASYEVGSLNDKNERGDRHGQSAQYASEQSP